MTPPVWWLRSLSGQCLKGTSVTSCFLRWGTYWRIAGFCKRVEILRRIFQSGFHPEHSITDALPRLVVASGSSSEALCAGGSISQMVQFLAVPSRLWWRWAWAAWQRKMIAGHSQAVREVLGWSSDMFIVLKLCRLHEYNGEMTPPGFRKKMKRPSVAEIGAGNSMSKGISAGPLKFQAFQTTARGGFHSQTGSREAVRLQPENIVIEEIQSSSPKTILSHDVWCCCYWQYICRLWPCRGYLWCRWRDGLLHQLGWDPQKQLVKEGGKVSLGSQDIPGRASLFDHAWYGWLFFSAIP